MRTFPTLALLAVALPLALTACDTYNNGYDDGYYDGQGSTSTRASFVDFSLDATDYTVSGDTRSASYESDNIDSGTTRAAVERALATAGDGALVALYIKSYLVNNLAGQGDPTYAALPVSRSFEELVFTPGPDSTTSTVNVVGYTASYEYSFDNQDIYFDVVSSAPASDFSSDPTVLFDFIVPQATDSQGTRGGANRLDFRVVTVPASALKQGVDMTDYAAVRAAFNLPD